MNGLRNFLATPNCPKGHGQMNRETFHWLSTLAISGALEVIFWVFVFSAYFVLLAFDALSFIWLVGAAVLVAIMLGVEWWVSSYRCGICRLSGTRSDFSQKQ